MTALKDSSGEQISVTKTKREHLFLPLLPRAHYIPTRTFASLMHFSHSAVF